MSYAVEIWGWSEIKQLEKIQTDYMRWVLKLDFCTPRYIIYKETDTRRLKIEWGRRAVDFEEKIKKHKDTRLTKMCWLEKVESGGRDNYSKERKAYYKGLGYSLKSIEDLKAKGKKISEYTVRVDSDCEIQSIEGNSGKAMRYSY